MKIAIAVAVFIVTCQAFSLPPNQDYSKEYRPDEGYYQEGGIRYPLKGYFQGNQYKPQQKPHFHSINEDRFFPEQPHFVSQQHDFIDLNEPCQGNSIGRPDYIALRHEPNYRFPRLHRFPQKYQSYQSQPGYFQDAYFQPQPSNQHQQQPKQQTFGVVESKEFEKEVNKK